MSPVILRQPPENMPKYGLITDNIAWVLLVCSFLFVLTRLGTKYAVSNKFGVDDVLIIVSLVRVGTLFPMRHRF
jgi:hypothetical protein